MPRYLIQSAVNWEFLHADPRSGDVAYTPSLLTAMRFGLVDDAEQVAQLIADHCDPGTSVVIDLDQELSA
jgi:hypothetical protein